MQDLPTINTVGRGGTAFSSFFENYKKELGDKFDVIIIMTDGGVWDLNKLISPNIETVWVLTNNYEAFNPPFGRVAPMRRF
jgi:predicted metal-dependent peptidase